jgi:hypothetical protein
MQPRPGRRTAPDLHEFQDAEKKPRWLWMAEVKLRLKPAGKTLRCVADLH